MKVQIFSGLSHVSVQEMLTVDDNRKDAIGATVPNLVKLSALGTSPGMLLRQSYLRLETTAWASSAKP